MQYSANVVSFVVFAAAVVDMANPVLRNYGSHPTDSKDSDVYGIDHDCVGPPTSWERRRRISSLLWHAFRLNSSTADFNDSIVSTNAPITSAVAIGGNDG